eukprot:TRINITY_DN22900_c0_g1_i1.p1 TRINITY_DN22900_c0_g1~~TRINITY_DN22900_c0_g1_i1.p1  ORF type:complete len:348 (+),score=86.56 TRINITY_DN22900_c0_g1_i1:73-1116(+)
MSGLHWEVIGGADKGGILVRTGQDMTSAEAESRLGFGAIVKQVQLLGDRLQYAKISGDGPKFGWVSIKLKDGKELLTKVDLKAKESQPTAVSQAAGYAGALESVTGESIGGRGEEVQDEEEDVEEEDEAIEPTLEGLVKALTSERQRRKDLERQTKKMTKEIRFLRARLNESPGMWKLQDRTPKIHPSAYVAPGAAIIGTVELEKDASVWFNCTVRGDNEQIKIGEGSDVQDNSILHCDPGMPLIIGKNCLIGHQVCLHGCKVGDNCLIGMRTTIMDNAEIGENTYVAAGTHIPEGKKIPPNSFVQGNPMKRIELEKMPGGLEAVQMAASAYVLNKERFKAHLQPLS